MTAHSGYAWGGSGNVHTEFVTDDSWIPAGLTSSAPASSGVSLGYHSSGYDTFYYPSEEPDESKRPTLTLRYY